jgi:EpsI family protein
MTPEWPKILVPVFLAAQALLVHWGQGTERPPAPPALAKFPAAFGDWRELHDNPVDPDVAATLRADRLLSRTYVNAAGEPVDFLVAWFQSQRAGASQPHSPQVCLPASGWTPVSTREIGLETAAGRVDANRYLVANRDARASVLYWYQTSRRTTAGEWASKFWLVADALRSHRTDTALVRVVVEDGGLGDARATTTAADFARAAYPVLREQLPR